MKLKLNKWVKLLIKLAITSLAIWIVLKKADFSQIVSIIIDAHPGFLLLALLFFILSKIAGAIRLKYFFKNSGLNISHTYNFRLYLIGMFHNLYLPGGVGGGGYKIYLLQKQYNTSVRSLIGATFFDRLNGLVVLVLLALLLSVISDLHLILQEYAWSMWALLLFGYPLYLLVMKRFFQAYHHYLIITSLYSFISQGLQLVCTLFLLYSLQVTNNILDYQALFMWATVLTIVPITFGGIGVREMIFIISHETLGLEQEIGVSISLLFFVITALVSFTGAFLPANKPFSEIKENQFASEN